MPTVGPLMRSKTVVLIFVLVTACLVSEGNSTSPVDSHPESLTTSFAVYTLSRGRGVPQPAREAFKEARALLEEAKENGKIVTLKQTRLGLEGESRLCAEFTDRDAARDMYERIHELMKGVELMNLAVEPCSER